MKLFLRSSVVIALAAIPAVAQAAQLVVTSYDMPNGDGQAHGGSYNYWDKNYTGAGAKTTDGAPLTGGVGDLTDGVVAGDFWFNVENTAGDGPYVGWYAASTLNPTVTFNLAGTPTVNEIRVHLDNSRAGGVYSPAAILIDGVNTAFAGPANGSIGWVTFSGLNLSGSSHTIQFQQDLRGWVFVSEVQFLGGGVPEPAAWAMMLAGFGMAGAAMRRRNDRTSVTYA